MEDISKSINFTKVINGYYREFKTIKDAQKWGSEQYKEIEKIKNYHHFKDSLERYCGFSYRNINCYLRGTCPNDFYPKESLVKHIEDIVEGINNTQALEYGIVLYRFVTENIFKCILMSSEKGFIEKGFISASLYGDIIRDRKIDESYARSTFILKIYVRSKYKGVYTTIVCGRPFGQEFLLSPSSKLFPVSKPYYDIMMVKIQNLY